MPEFILVNTQIPENLGASARAMLNFGQKKMSIVAPKFDLANEKIIPLAAGADEILQGLKVYSTLGEAIKKLNIIIATTNRTRSIKKKQINFDKLCKLFDDKRNKVGIIFGPEKSGLNNDDISMCDFLLKIESNVKFSSLNLSHAVAIVSHEIMKNQKLRLKQNFIPVLKNNEQASKSELINFFSLLENNLEDSDFFLVKERKNIMRQKIRNIFNKLELTSNDIKTLLGIIKSLKKTSKK